ncbi:MAG TPA: EcsC family protein [Chitinophagales bacterium]|nr:EcsC family protein [Chitinophagales bacterium]
MDLYEERILAELQAWQKRMVRNPSLVNRATKKIQDKLNNLIPEKIHRGITRAIKGMVRTVLFGAKFTTKRAVKNQSFEAREAVVQEKINFYKKAAAAEGGITGFTGIVGSLADFPILLSMKIKLLFEIATQYGYSVKDYKERLYILYIFQLAFCSPKARQEVFLKMLNWKEHSKELPDDIHQFDWRTFQREYRDYIDLAKLGQMIPIVGAPIGAIANYKLIEKLGHTAMNAYRMRVTVL